MTALKNPKAIATMSTAFFIASLFWLMSTKSVNNTLESSLQHERLRSESLLSEKLLLEKDLEKMKSQLSALKGVNSELDELVRSTEAKVSSQQEQLRQLRKNSTGLANLKKQREELLTIQRDLQAQLIVAKASMVDLELQNTALAQTIAQLQEQNLALSNDLNRAMVASLDHLQVQAVKGKKEKLTVRARKTSKLIASFEIPASLQNVSFRIIAPGGNRLTEKHGSIVFQTSASDKNLLAAADTQGVDGLQNVRMEYVPKVRLQSGVYTVEILNDNLHVGSMNVKLR